MSEDLFEGFVFSWHNPRWFSQAPLQCHSCNSVQFDILCSNGAEGQIRCQHCGANYHIFMFVSVLHTTVNHGRSGLMELM